MDVSSVFTFLQLSPLEVFAAAITLLNVWLITRRSMWNWPIGILSTILYTYIMFEYKLYSDTLTQVFFTIVQVVGWMQWARVKEDNGQVPVGTLKSEDFMFIMALVGLGTFADGFLMSTLTDAAYPYWDAVILAFSVAAQFMLNFRRIESWLLWIVVDLDAIPLYWAKGLYSTSVLYVIFLVISIKGLIDWNREWKKESERLADTAKFVEENIA